VGILLLEAAKAGIPLADPSEELARVKGILGRAAHVKEEGPQVLIH
jgi:UDP-N-acetylmuramyl tripeptide synthase